MTPRFHWRGKSTKEKRASSKQFLAMFTVALFTIAKRLSTPKVLNREAEIYGQLHEQWNINQPLKGRAQATTGLDLWNIMLSDRHRSQNDKYGMISFL